MIKAPALKLAHLLALTDDTGMFQHAKFNIPNYREGYTTDDNARAALLALKLEQEPGSEAAAFQQRANRYLALLWYAFNAENGRFRNFLSYDRNWLEEAGSEDSHGRALMALGMIFGKTASENRREFVEELFKRAVPAVIKFTSPRAWAFSVLGLIEFLKKSGDEKNLRAFSEMLAEKLIACYRANADADWRWFEGSLSYANARLSQALIAAGTWMNNAEMTGAGLQSLDWLIEQQRSESGCFSPIGSDGFYVRHGERAKWDQQPIEAWNTLTACIQAFHATTDERWKNEARRIFSWFLGNNDVGVPLYDRETGGCYDGLHAERVNKNQGAESSLAFALSLVEIRELER